MLRSQLIRADCGLHLIDFKVRFQNPTLTTMKSTAFIFWFVLSTLSLTSAADLDQSYAAISTKIDAFNSFLNDKSLDPEAKREALVEVVHDMVDFEAVADRALGPYASEITDEQRDQFAVPFKQALTYWLVDDLMRFEDESIELSEFTWLPDAQKALVKTLGREKPGFGASARYNRRSQSQFVLQQQDSSWRVVDLTINRVNIANNFYSQIDGLMRRGKSFEEVLERMQALSGVR